jgi:hypothetical protein
MNTSSSTGADTTSRIASTTVPRTTAPSLSTGQDSGDSIVIGEGDNTVKPSGDGQIGIDATDSVCVELKRDLNKTINETLADLNDSVDQTLADMKAQGISSEYLPSRQELKAQLPTRQELKDQLSGALRANGCSGY